MVYPSLPQYYVAATTITFSFVGPKDDGGLPTRAYAVQYKEERRNWNEALNKTWPIGKCISLLLLLFLLLLAYHFYAVFATHRFAVYFGGP